MWQNTVQQGGGGGEGGWRWGIKREGVGDDKFLTLKRRGRGGGGLNRGFTVVIVGSLQSY